MRKIAMFGKCILIGAQGQTPDVTLGILLPCVLADIYLAPKLYLAIRRYPLVHVKERENKPCKEL